MFKTKRFWLGLAIIGVSLLFAFKGIQFEELTRALTHIDPLYIFPAIAAFWLSYGPRALRWQLLYTPYHVRSTKVLSTLSIGYFLSNIAPLRAGDWVRAYLLARSESVPVARSLTSVVVERVMDALTIVLFLVALLPFIHLIPNEARVAAAAVGASGIVALVAFALISLNRERAVALSKRLTSRISLLRREAIWRAIEHLIDGFSVLHSWRPLAGVIAWSVIIWFFAALLNWIVMLSMGIHLGLDAAAFVLVATSLGVTVIPTPGQFGVFEVVAQQALVQVYHVEPSAALAYAFLSHAFVYIWLTVLGVIGMWREGLSYGQIQKVAGEGENTDSSLRAPVPTPAKIDSKI